MFSIDDPSKTFWDDPSMYLEDTGLDTLMSLTTEHLLASNNRDVTTNMQIGIGEQKMKDKGKMNPKTEKLDYDDKPYLKRSLLKICVEDPSQTFWDDPNMYVEDPGLESLLALANEELLVCNNQDVTMTENLHHHTGKMINPKNQLTNESKQTAQMCMYPNCTKSFFKTSLLKMHMRRHLGVKPYMCMWPGCSWSFSRSDERLRHCRSHSGIKPYGCDKCDKRFSRSDHLVKHSRIHQRSTSMPQRKIVKAASTTITTVSATEKKFVK